MTSRLYKLALLPKYAKQALILSLDLLLVPLSIFLAYAVRLETIDISVIAEFSTNSISQKLGLSEPRVSQIPDILWIIGFSIVLSTIIFIRIGLYRAVMRFIGYKAILVILFGTFFLCFVTFCLLLLADATYSLSVIILTWVFLLLSVGGSRITMRYLFFRAYLKQRRSPDPTGVLIYGAGSCGQDFARHIEGNPNLFLVGFLDDDKTKHSREIDGLRVFNPEFLESIIKRYAISEILLAIPSATTDERRRVLENLRSTNIKIRTLPPISSLYEPNAQNGLADDIDLFDLLGREPVETNDDLIREFAKDRVIIVSGAGGSIGRKLCEHLMAFTPKALILLEQNEYALYRTHQKLLSKFSIAEELQNQPENNQKHKIGVIPVLGSVCQDKLVERLVEDWKPFAFFHSAAHKHVPMVEANIAEGVRNNVFGTLVVAKACMKYQVQNFVLISSDKAVRPTNVMGATKRLSELILQALSPKNNVNFNTEELEEPASKNRTNFSIVRFGNVLGSSGSVVPLFARQIANGGPITLTHENVSRYFMLIDEAVSLVTQAAAMQNYEKQRTPLQKKEADVFVLDMGEPIRIADLAKRMVRLSGNTLLNSGNPEGDIEIKIVGLRPGEKLFEELLIGKHTIPTEHDRIIRAKEVYKDWDTLGPMLVRLENCVDEGDPDLIKAALRDIVPEFSTSN